MGVRHTRHARGRSARRPPPSLAADHAAALWQLWCRVGRTTTITCQVVESHALYHRLQRATGAGRGAHAGTAQRAGDGGRTYPANQHRVSIHTLSCVRRLTMLVPIGTAFGYGTRTHTLSRTLRSPSIGRAEARATDATRGDSRALLDESTARAGRVDRSRRSSGPLAKVESTGARGEWTSREWRVGEFQGATRRYTGSTRSVEWPHGESTRRGASVHSVRRGARGGGELAGASRPPPVPVPPPLPLQALPRRLRTCVAIPQCWSPTPTQEHGVLAMMKAPLRPGTLGPSARRRCTARSVEATRQPTGLNVRRATPGGGGPRPQARRLLTLHTYLLSSKSTPNCGYICHPPRLG